MPQEHTESILIQLNGLQPDEDAKVLSNQIGWITLPEQSESKSSLITTNIFLFRIFWFGKCFFRQRFIRILLPFLVFGIYHINLFSPLLSLLIFPLPKHIAISVTAFSVGGRSTVLKRAFILERRASKSSYHPPTYTNTHTHPMTLVPSRETPDQIFTSISAIRMSSIHLLSCLGRSLHFCLSLHGAPMC